MDYVYSREKGEDKTQNLCYQLSMSKKKTFHIKFTSMSTTFVLNSFS